jgi:tetratricopeptide (TPR) repeat protein
MAFDMKQLRRVAHRLREASGYLELGMAQHALDRLDDVGELGPFEGEVSLLRGEAFGAQEKFPEAAASFKTAAKLLPPPYRQPAFLALSMVYQEAGDTDRANQALARARCTGDPPRPKKSK